jgi:hypothetical protein
MTDKKMSILYTIKGIQPYSPINGFVAILLSPVDKIPDSKVKKPNINMGIVGQEGPIPNDVMEQMQEIFQQMTGMGKRDNNKDREIILIESEMVFQKRGWRYGDTITATFEKIED